MDLKRYRALRNWRYRIPFLFVMFLIYALGDEFIKEGYFFDFNDMFIPFTHENIILVFSSGFGIAYLILYLIEKKKGKKFLEESFGYRPKLIYPYEFSRKELFYIFILGLFPVLGIFLLKFFYELSFNKDILKVLGIVLLIHYFGFYLIDSLLAISIMFLEIFLFLS